MRKSWKYVAPNQTKAALDLQPSVPGPPSPACQAPAILPDLLEIASNFA